MIPELKEKLKQCMNEMEKLSSSLSPQQQKAIKIANAIIDVSAKITHEVKFLRKKPRIFRKKPYSRGEASRRTIMILMMAELTRSQVNMIMQMPIPKNDYKPGGIDFNKPNASLTQPETISLFRSISPGDFAGLGMHRPSDS